MDFQGSEEARLKIIDASLAIYRHHWDAYLKGVAFYFAAVSILIGILFSNPCIDQSDVAVSAIVCVASAIACVGNYYSIRWFTGFNNDMERLFEPLGGTPLNFSMSGQIPKIFFAISLIISLCGLAGAFWSNLHLGEACDKPSGTAAPASG